MIPNHPERLPSPARRMAQHMQLASWAFDEWWQDVGSVLSQRISVGLGSDTPQEVMRRIFVDAYVLGLEERSGLTPGLSRRSDDLL